MIQIPKNSIYTLRWYFNNGYKDEVLKMLAEMLGEQEKEETSDPITEIEETPVVEESKPVEVAPDFTKKYKVALVVGHNARAKGAYAGATINQSEFDYNNRVADWLIANAPPHVEYRRFNRVNVGSYSREITTVYAAVNSWNPDFSVELHFNAGNRADYITMLYASGSISSLKCAQAMQNEFVKGLGFRDFGLMPRTRGQNGAGSLFAARGPIVLTEPFFGDNPTHTSVVGAMGIPGFGKIYQNAIDSALLTL